MRRSTVLSLPPQLVLPGANFVKLFTVVSYKFSNNLERLSPEPTQVKHLSSAPL
jgi:hypothetical protein